MGVSSSKSDTIQDVEMFILNVQASIKPYVFQLRQLLIMFTNKNVYFLKRLRNPHCIINYYRYFTGH